MSELRLAWAYLAARPLLTALHVAMVAVGMAAMVVALLASGNCALAVALVNPGFDAQDASGGDIPGATGWGQFNAAFTTQGVPALSAPNSLKIFGPFFQFGGAGVFQGGFAASEGQLWEASAYARIDSSDPMNPANLAVVKVEFLNSSNSVIGFAESPQILCSGYLLTPYGDRRGMDEHLPAVPIANKQRRAYGRAHDDRGDPAGRCASPSDNGSAA